MSGLFNSPKAPSAKPLFDDEEEATLEPRDDILMGSAGDDTLIGAGGTLEERPPLSIAPPPKPEWIGALANDDPVTTVIPRKMPQGQPPTVPAIPPGDGPGSREFKEIILPEFERAMKITAKHEGGLAPDGTFKGMDQGALNELVKQDPDRWEAIKDKTSTEPKAIPSRDIPDNVRRGIYYWHYFSEPQLDLLAAIPGLAEAEPQLAAQMFDAQVMHWGEPHLWLKESLNEVGLSPDKLNPDEIKKVIDQEAVTLGIPTQSIEYIRNNLVSGPDGKFRLKKDAITGPVVRAAVKIALDAGKIHEVNDRIAEKRLDYMEKHKDRPKNPGWPPRGRSFHTDAPTYGPYGKSGVRPY